MSVIDVVDVFSHSRTNPFLVENAATAHGYADNTSKFKQSMSISVKNKAYYNIIASR